MADVLIRRGNAEPWREPDTTTVGTESELQDLIESSPHLVPGIVDGPVAVAREFPAGTGRADVVLVGSDGSLTIVECKLDSNPEIRRSVVGQLFAYAAALWRTAYEQLDAAFASRTGQSLVDSLADGAEDFDEEIFRQALGKNLERGAFRLAFAVNEITDELKETVLYLNRHTTEDLTVLALELRFIADRDVEILVPHTYGEESGREKATRRRMTSITDYREVLTDQHYEIVQELFDRFQAALAELDLPWAPGQFARQWLIFKGPGGRPRAGIDFFRTKGVELWVRLPADLDEASDNPYPGLESYWQGKYHQLQWKIPTLDDVPDLRVAINLASRYDEESLPSR